jgi:LysM repeat protein
VTRKQVAFLIAVNAVVSAAITLLLVLVILPALGAPVAVPGEPTATSGPIAAPVTEPAVGPQPSPTPLIHIVQAGDTISGLSQRYDVPAADIIAANQVQNPNFLQLGTELVIPMAGLAEEATPTLTPVPTPTDTPIPFEPPPALTATAAAAQSMATETPAALPSSGELEVKIGEVLGAGDVSVERVIIANTGERLADMQGWTLSDAGGNVYTFANFRLWKGGSAIVHTGIGEDGNPPANFYWGKLEALWTPGEIATLRDRDNQVIDTYTVP